MFPSVNNTATAPDSTCNDDNSNVAVIATANTNWNDLYLVTLLAMMYLLLLSVQAKRMMTFSLPWTKVSDQFHAEELRNF